MLGRTTLDATESSSSLLDSIGNSIKGEVNDLIGDVAKALNIHDFYSAHLLNYCEGYFTPGPVANKTVDPDKNVTQCSNRTALFHFDPTAAIQRELKPGISLADLEWPSTIQDAVHAVEVASKAMFVLYCVGVAATGLALLGAFVGVFSDGRAAPLANNALASVSENSCIGFLTSRLKDVACTVVFRDRIGYRHCDHVESGARGQQAR